MLIVRVSAVFSDDGLSVQLLLEFGDLLFLESFEDDKPGPGDECGELISLSLVGLDVSEFFDEDGDILGGDDPLISGCEVGDLCVLAVGLVEPVDVDSGSVLLGQLLVAGEDVFDL